MTHLRFRRHADDDQDATEHLQAIKPASWDATPITWTGAGAGLAPDEFYAGDDPAAGLRQAIELTALAERGPGPDALCPACRRYVCICGEPKPGPGTGPVRLRAMPPPPVPAGRDVSAGAHDDDRIGRGMERGWPRLSEVRCEFPAADVATPIPCGAVHRDPAARSFRALRASAFAAGWHLDGLGRWACPDCCQASPGYRTLYPLTVWDPDAAQARLARDPDGEFRARAAAEHDLFRSVRDARARHAGGPR